MIHINELMIGDWVFCTYPSINKPVRVAEIKTVGDNKLKIVIYDDDVRLVFNEIYIDPIPLTVEILEKNWFTYSKNNGSFGLSTTISYGNWDVDVVLFNVTDKYRNNQLHIATPDDSITLLHLMKCNHVHQLQHALRLCWIEKEIEL